MVPQTPQQPSDPNGGPNLQNGPRSMETSESFKNSVKKSTTVRSAVASVIQTRSDFAKFLLQIRIKLLTSASELDETGDFIASSYVTYLDYNDFKEPLSVFLQRYPQYVEMANYVAVNTQDSKGKTGLKTKHYSREESLYQ